jgi:hypothetical protein
MRSGGGQINESDFFDTGNRHPSLPPLLLLNASSGQKILLLGKSIHSINIKNCWTKSVDSNKVTLLPNRGYVAVFRGEAEAVGFALNPAQYSCHPSQ